MTSGTSTHDGKRIVVGVDGSEPSKAALRWALLAAAMTGATIDAVIAWHFPTNVGIVSVPAGWDPASDASTVLTETVDAVFSDGRPTGMRLRVVEGNPAKVLLDASAGAELLAVGSRGHGGFVGLLLGSVSANVAEHAKCPVLIVHGHQPLPTLPTPA
jgi:nucleotide-binding universal stress UspA family protein